MATTLTTPLKKLPKLKPVKLDFKPISVNVVDKIISRQMAEFESENKRLKGKLIDSTKYPKWR